MADLDPQALHEAIADSIAMVTRALDEVSDANLLTDALGIIERRDDEELSAWIMRAAVLVATQAAVTSGIVQHLARIIGCEPEHIIRGIAIRQAARREGDGR